MQAETWGRVKRLFEAALPLTGGAREHFLNQQCTEPTTRAEVESLLAVHDDDPGFLDGAHPVLDSDTLTLFDAQLADRRIGPWRVTREIGRGGMGVVWEAERADGEFEQRVAVKFVQHAIAGEADRARMRAEARILARLDHPSIARLLDGGSTADGHPYIVMEYVDGEPLDAWCDGRSLGVRERLGVFLRVCSAVEYAHRHLVVHRDIKPGNVLVTADGVAKLLDFGIARILDSQDGTTADPGKTAAVLTPDYASPEQVRGEPVTTASDVYSLGVVLYVLLAGRKPYKVDGPGPLAILRAVNEQEPAPPSAYAPPERARTIRGELDAIVLQALRKEPDERYQSVHALADDLRAWLDNRPVAAHRPSAWRRIGKFAARQKAVAAALAIALTAVVLGATLTLWQAHVARQERARAELRFAEVRKFSRSVLFELHESIRNLPGATAARALLLQRATDLLDGLAKDAGADSELKIELAEGYRRLGHVLGSGFSDNLGRREEAIAAYRKGAALAEPVVAAAPDNVEATLVLTGVYDDLTDAYAMGMDFAQADHWFGKHRALVNKVDATQARDPKVRASLATSYAALGFYTAQRNDLDGAKALYERSIERFEAVTREGENSRSTRSQYAFALKRLGAILISRDDLGRAERLYRQALAIEDSLMRERAPARSTSVDRTFTMSDLALIQKRRGQLPEAARGYEEVLRIRKDALQAEPSNQRFIGLTASVELNLASVYSTLGRHAEAIQLAREAVDLRDQGASTTGGFREQVQAAGARIALARAMLNAPDRRFAAEATAVLSKARATVEALRKRVSLTPTDESVVSDWEEVSRRARRGG